ncbi:ATP-dependent Clp protease ATP-binding subunit [Moorena sp. SIO3A2]|uniref:ATP-dependent Clp protease ATP-binding subunit n=1 Tax=Moorena sp. SIO3A2 TaxID=2607841 RepID=UPI0013B805E5|nr:ATP-dependent Clp protease ATP-binding subunit [Moorena sp. SIO3A2]NER90276.1 ATP-dependent Clp protease ATP-binding subunit [Moorena sp. SIO3A2]
MFEHFTDKAIKSIMLAQEETRRLGHSLVGTEQLLLGLIAQRTAVAARVLRDFGVTLEDARYSVENTVGRGSRMVSSELPFTPKAKEVFQQSFQEAKQLGHNYIDTEHLLLAIIQDRNSVASQVLVNLGVDLTELRTHVNSSIAELTAATTAKGQGSSFIGNTQNQKATLEEFGTNLTKLAAEGKLDPVVGRQQEIERVVQILGRRSKNNPILLGEPGVGKTAIAEGLAQRIVSQDVPDLLADKQVISLDMALLVSGTRFRGDFEERLKQVVSEVQQSGNIILVIDEIHTLVGAGSLEGGMDAANLLKPALARGELQCLGATTLDEYRKYIEKDAALERRFQPVMVSEPSVEDTIDILHGLRSTYEEYHKVQISDQALLAAAQLSDRYISDRYLPDKAIDLIDEAGSRVHLMHSKPSSRARAESEWESEGIEGKLSPSPTIPIVDQEDIAQIVASWTGIPVNKLTESESALLLHLEETLHERIIGQDEAVTAVSRAIRRARVGLKDPNRPIASFIFSGPTGVGKTELAKSLASYLFGSEDKMIRLDMSEYMERHTVSKLIGSPPGFVGYDEGGQLTEAVRRQPYSVVLFDEIEKAHPDVFNVLLQLLDDGRLTDARGRTVDFKNTILIMTSNIGSKVIEKGGSVFGFESSKTYEESRYNQIRTQVNENLKDYFRPEFLNRLDDIIVFRQLKKNEVKEIAEILLQEISSSIQEKGIILEVTEAFKDHLVKAGYEPSYGARPLRRAIMSLLEDSLAEAMLSGQIQEGDTAVVDVDDHGQVTVLSANAQKRLRQPVGVC